MLHNYDIKACYWQARWSGGVHKSKQIGLIWKDIFSAYISKNSMHLSLKFQTLANCDTQDGMMLEFGVDLINSHWFINESFCVNNLQSYIGDCTFLYLSPSAFFHWCRITSDFLDAFMRNAFFCVTNLQSYICDCTFLYLSQSAFFHWCRITSDFLDAFMRNAFLLQTPMSRVSYNISSL